jgi:hypothetical protein
MMAKLVRRVMFDTGLSREPNTRSGWQFARLTNSNSDTWTNCATVQSAGRHKMWRTFAIFG